MGESKRLKTIPAPHATHRACFLRRWSAEENAVLAAAVEKNGRVVHPVAELFPGRSHAQCQQRWSRVLKPGIKKGQWTAAEDSQSHSLVARGYRSEVHAEFVSKAIDLDRKYCGTTTGSRPGPSEQRLIGLGPVQPLVLGHYGELSTFIEELLSTAADAGAQKHWRGMRCASAEDAHGLIASMLRRSWDMAAFRLNARLVIRRLQHVSGAKVPGYILPLSRVRRRFRRQRDYASEHCGRNHHSEGMH